MQIYGICQTLACLQEIGTGWTCFPCGKIIVRGLWKRWICAQELFDQSQHSLCRIILAAIDNNDSEFWLFFVQLAKGCSSNAWAMSVIILQTDIWSWLLKRRKQICVNTGCKVLEFWRTLPAGNYDEPTGWPEGFDSLTEECPGGLNVPQDANGGVWLVISLSEAVEYDRETQTGQKSAGATNTT